MAEEQINVGDVVQVKSGGPKMTVELIRPEDIWCVWFAEMKHEHGTFKRGTLKKVDPAA